jgi:IS4 transposase
VAGSATRLKPVLKELTGDRAPLCPGYEVRVLDGNHLAASEKRLAALRSLRGAALPGHSLVVYDPDLRMVIDLVPCEDAYAQERTLMPSVLAAARPGELWIADRNFSTTGILSGWHHRGAAFLVREHASSPNPKALGELREVGRVGTGMVFEQAVQIGADQDAIRLRRIEVHLDQPTEDGDKIIRLLTDLPDTKSAQDIATLYRRRWTIESMFQWLESVLHSEVRTLGYPRAALFAFSVALLAFNVLSTIQVAVEREHDIDPQDNAGISLYYVTNEIKTGYRGMMIAIPPEAWRSYQGLSDADLSRVFLEIAAKVAPKTLRKHPRGPKKIVRKPDIPGYLVSSHHSTARAIANLRSTK